MAKAFSIRDFMQDARQQDSDSDMYEKVSVYDIGLNPKNECPKDMMGNTIQRLMSRLGRIISKD